MRVGKRHPLYTAKRGIRRRGITWQFLDSQAGKRLIPAPRRLLRRYDLRVFRGGWKVPPIWENQQKYGYPIHQTMPGLHPGLLLAYIRLHFRLLLDCAGLHFRPHITSRPETAAAGLHGSFFSSWKKTRPSWLFMSMSWIGKQLQLAHLETQLASLRC